MKVFLPGNVPSLKNSRIKTARGVFHSKQVRQYLSFLGIKKYSLRKKEVEKMKTRPNLFDKHCRPLEEVTKKGNYPYIFKLHFIRDSRRKFDFHNASHIIFDLLQAHGIIEDDNMDCCLPFPLKIDGKWYSVDKENAGIIIEVWDNYEY